MRIGRDRSLEKSYSFHLHVHLSRIRELIPVARGFTKAGHQGNPDDAKAARILLKDFVNGKIIYCHPPPDISPEDFNRDHYTPTAIIPKTLNPNAPKMEDGRDDVDDGFFRESAPRAMTREGVFIGRNTQYGFQKSVGNDGRVLSRKERKVKGDSLEEGHGKKHFKGRGKK
jgi:large subunit GTPase 1